MIAPAPEKPSSTMSLGSPTPFVNSIAINVPPSADMVEENGARRQNARRTMGSPEVPEEPYYRLAPKDARCPVCRVGSLSKRFTCCGVFLGIALFPLGLVPCFLMRELRCNHCHHRPYPEDSQTTPE